MDLISPDQRSPALSEAVIVHVNQECHQNVNIEAHRHIDRLLVHNGAQLEEQINLQAQDNEYNGTAARTRHVHLSAELARIGAHNDSRYTSLAQQVRAGRTEACLRDLDSASWKWRVKNVENDLIDREVDLERKLEGLTLKEDLEMLDRRVDKLDDWRIMQGGAMASLQRRQSQIASTTQALQGTVERYDSLIIRLEQVQGDCTRDNTSLQQQYMESQQQYMESRADHQAQQLQMAQRVDLLSEQQNHSVAELHSELGTLSGNQDHTASEIEDKIQGLRQSLDHVNATLGEFGKASRNSIDHVRQEAMGRLTELTEGLQACSILVSDLASNEPCRAETLNALAASVQQGNSVLNDLGTSQEAQRLRLDEYGAASAFIAERVDQAMSGLLNTGMSRAIQEIQVQVCNLLDIQSTRPAIVSEQASRQPEQPATSVPPTPPYAFPMIQPPSPPIESHGDGRVIINGHCEKVVIRSGTGDTHTAFLPASHVIHSNPELEKHVRIPTKDFENIQRMVSEMLDRIRQTEEAKLVLEEKLRLRDAQTTGDDAAIEVRSENVLEREHENSQLRQQVWELKAQIEVLTRQIAAKHEERNSDPASNDHVANTPADAEGIAASPTRPKLKLITDPQAHPTNNAASAQNDATPHTSMIDSDNAKAGSSAPSTPLNQDVPSKHREEKDGDIETLAQKIREDMQKSNTIHDKNIEKHKQALEKLRYLDEFLRRTKYIPSSSKEIDEVKRQLKTLPAKMTGMLHDLQQCLQSDKKDAEDILRELNDLQAPWKRFI
ncbi:MAG: hypothetical protein Q9220_007661 [cf. Caloplaca sp. 1 TL-2023]